MEIESKDLATDQQIQPIGGTSNLFEVLASGDIEQLNEHLEILLSSFSSEPNNNNSTTNSLEHYLPYLIRLQSSLESEESIQYQHQGNSHDKDSKSSNGSKTNDRNNKKQLQSSKAAEKLTKLITLSASNQVSCMEFWDMLPLSSRY